MDVFGDVSQIVLRGRRNTFAMFSEHALNLSWQAQHNRIDRAALSGDKVQIAWQAWHFVRYDEICRKPRTKHRF